MLYELDTPESILSLRQRSRKATKHHAKAICFTYG